MKKLVVLILFIFMGDHIQAQNYGNYLQTAVNLLNEGNIDTAKRAYEIYKQLSNKSDSVFEELFDKAKNGLFWMDSCHIVKLNDTTSLAVQEIDKKQIPVKYVDAEVAAQSSKLFGFTDWTLPNQSEMAIIIQDLPADLLVYPYYWCSSLSVSASRTLVTRRQTKYTNMKTGHTEISTKNIPNTYEGSRFSYSVMSKSGEAIVTYKKDIETKNGIIIKSNITGDEHFKSHYIIVRVFRTENPNSPILRGKETVASKTIVKINNQ